MTFLENGEIINEDKGNYKISELFYDILFAGIFLLIPIPINRYISLRLLWLMYTMGSYGAHTLNPVDNATVNSMSNETRSSHQLNYKELTRLSFNFDDYNKKEVQNNINITMDVLEQLPIMYGIVPSQEQPSEGSERIHTENGEGGTLMPIKAVNQSGRKVPLWLVRTASQLLKMYTTLLVRSRR